MYPGPFLKIKEVYFFHSKVNCLIFKGIGNYKFYELWMT